MLTDDELRKAFIDTNDSEPLENGWDGLEPFARRIEVLATAKAADVCLRKAAEFFDQANKELDINHQGELMNIGRRYVSLSAEIRDIQRYGVVDIAREHQRTHQLIYDLDLANQAIQSNPFLPPKKTR